MDITLPALRRSAQEMRIDIIKMLHAAGSGHPGGSLSLIDLLTVIMTRYVKRTPDNVSDPDRNRFILSKGHGVPALYAVLAKLGVIGHDELLSLRTIDSRLQGHPHNASLPAVEASTGSLGQGLSIAQGMAMTAKLDSKEYKVYCVIGDGETQEGQIWEVLLSAPMHKLDNLIVVLDYNKGQIDGSTNDIVNLEPLAEKLISFNWHVQEIDGHDFEAIDQALQNTQNYGGKPHFIIAHTKKGKGVSFMEHPTEWHGKAPNDEQAAAAIKELEATLN
ncbi:MAG: transketolase [Ignavibacteria bacterium]|nr:MAG: transketolase [Ignavibacteria bacterium]